MTEEDSQPSLRVLLGAFLVAAIVVSVVGVFVVDLPTQEEIAEERAYFTEYCHSIYSDDAEVYTANDAMNAEHNGLHCSSNQGMIHRSQIPPDVWEQYKAGEVSAAYVTERLEPKPGILSMLGNLRLVGFTALLVTGALAVTLLIGRRNVDDTDPKDE